MRNDRNQVVRRLVHAQKHDDVLVLGYEENRIHVIVFKDRRIRRQGRVVRSRPIHGGHVVEPKAYGGIHRPIKSVGDSDKHEKLTHLDDVHVTVNLKADSAMKNLHVTGKVQGDIPKSAKPVGDDGAREAFIPLMATHTNPPHSLIKRTWNRVKGVLHRGH